MRRRDILLAAPMALIGGLQSGEGCPQNERKVARKGKEGLESIEWKDIKPGDELILFDWKDGRIVKITWTTKATTYPDSSKKGWPVEFETLGWEHLLGCNFEMDCCVKD